MSAPLRVARDGAEPGDLSMGRDALLAECVAGGAAGVVRSHDWRAACVSFGRGQRPAALSLARLAEAGALAVRRPTGGGWLLHLPGDLAVTYAGPLPREPGALRAAARSIARAIAEGIAKCGVAARITKGADGESRAPASRAEVCFARSDPDEVVAHGVKLAGVALGRVRGAVLVQAAIPLARPDGALAALAAEWDPRRAAAVDLLAGTTRGSLESAVLARVAPGLPRGRPWTWDTSLDARAAAKRSAATLGLPGDSGGSDAQGE